MISALRVIWRGIGQFERYGWLYVLANLLAVALSLPIVTMPAAFAGLSRLSYTAQTSHTTDMGSFWAGFRSALRRGVVIGVANVVVLGILIANFWSYRQQSGLLIGALRTIWMIILIGWLMVQLYLWPV